MMPDHAGRRPGGLAGDHESIATAFASGGQWRQAYEHLRTALELHRADLRLAGPHQLDRQPGHAPDQQPEPTAAGGPYPVRVPAQLAREVDRLRREHAEAMLDSIRDSLTNSFNRRYLDQRLVALHAELAGGRRAEPAAPAAPAVALIDLDHFKQVNDGYGHLVGDRVLRQVVQLLCVDLPAGAFCARFGGEEFAVVLPGTDPPAAVAVCEAARARIERYPWPEFATGLRVTVSVGIADDGPAGTRTDAEQQLLRADVLLYAAKRSGRNAVAYRAGGRIHLAGPASSRRGIQQLPVLRQTEQSARP